MRRSFACKASLAALVALATAGFSTAASAHIGGHAGGFANGLAHPFGSKSPFAIAFGEWRRLFSDMKTATGARDALRIALGRP